MMHVPWRAVAGFAALCCGVALGDPSHSDAQIVIGDSTQRVVELLGPPDGVFQKGQKETYIYDRGLVDFMHGAVTRADLLTADEVKLRDTERTWEEGERHRRQDVVRRSAMEQGLAEKVLKLQDPKFLKASGQDRYAYWLAFSRRFPGVDVAAELAAAEKDAQAHQQADAAASRKTTMQGRVREIAARLKELDTAYAASLAHWKRNEINVERANLARELADISLQLIESKGGAKAGS